MKKKAGIITAGITAALMLTATSLIEGGGRTIVFTGDSITDGNWGQPEGWPCHTEKRNEWDRNHVYGHGYAEMVIGELSATEPDASNHYYNRGISGNTLAQLAERWDRDVMALEPTVVSVLIGTNDVHYALERGETTLDYEGWEATLDSLVAVTQERRPGVRVILGTPFTAKSGNPGRSADYAARAEMTLRLDSIVEAVGKRRGATVVDFGLMVRNLTDDTTAVTADYWIWDGVHPTTALHNLMAKEWLKKFRGEE